MALRRKTTTKKPRGGVNSRAANSAANASLHLPHIAELINDGEITVGVLRPVGCVAVASDGHNSLAMLVRRRNETLAQLLIRLDQAIAKAYNEDVYTDEINPPPQRP